MSNDLNFLMRLDWYMMICIYIYTHVYKHIPNDFPNDSRGTHGGHPLAHSPGPTASLWSHEDGRPGGTDAFLG